jgi:hypothetical protein
MAKMTKAQMRKRLEEANTKITKVFSSSVSNIYTAGSVFHPITPKEYEAWNKLYKSAMKKLRP